MIDKGTAARAEGAPTNARLRDVLSGAGHVVIVDAPPDEADFAERARTVVTGDDIADLARLLAIVEGGNGDRCRCSGWPTIRVHAADDRLIACWTLHHQSGLRGMGDCDADLRDGPALTEWLAERGLTGSREVQAELAVQAAEAEQRRTRWIQAAPAGLTDVAAVVAASPDHDYEGWSRRLRESEDRLAALLRRNYPNGIERVRALLAWAGIASRESKGGQMWYDAVVQRRLLAEDSALILTASSEQPLSLAQLDGAAELFVSIEWTRSHGRQLPEPLRSRLLGHIQAHGTDAMKYRMSHGYYGAAERSD